MYNTNILLKVNAVKKFGNNYHDKHNSLSLTLMLSMLANYTIANILNADFETWLF